MVEFGLKLEDNKVDEWSSQYIDYEKLKTILSRAKASAANRDDLLKRLPPNAVAEATRLRESVDAAPQAAAASASPNNGGDEKSSRSPSNDDAAATDATPLLKRSNSQSSQHSFNLMTNVRSYLGLADDKSMYLQACDRADADLDLFIKCYGEQVAKVRTFYDERTQEISQRIDVLVDTVGSSGFADVREKVSGRQNKRTSIFDRILHGGSAMWGELSHSRGDSSLPDIHLDHSESIDLDEENVAGGRQQLHRELKRSSDSIKRAIEDMYRTAKLLHNYSIMNYTGFVKIAKKFDKTFPSRKGMFRDDICEDGRQAEALASKMERMYGRWFCDDDVREAKVQMLTKRGDGLLTDWTQLRLGYRLGMCSVLALWLAWDCVWGQFEEGRASIGGRSAFPVFRGVFGLLAWHWFWGVSVYVWTRFRINYIFLFDFDPRNVNTPVDIFNDAVDETLVFLLCTLMYYKADVGAMPLWIPPRAYPTFLILYTIKCLIFPLRTRRPLWNAIKQVFMAPFLPPTFFLTFVGDVFTRCV